MFSRVFAVRGRAPKLAALTVLLFMVFLFFKMVRTLEPHRRRRHFFAALGFFFPFGFMRDLVALEGYPLRCWLLTISEAPLFRTVPVVPMGGLAAVPALEPLTVSLERS